MFVGFTWIDLEKHLIFLACTQHTGKENDSTNNNNVIIAINCVEKQKVFGMCKNTQNGNSNRHQSEEHAHGPNETCDWMSQK